MIRFTCSDTKNLSNIKMSQNIMTRIAVLNIELLKFLILNKNALAHLLNFTER